MKTSLRTLLSGPAGPYIVLAAAIVLPGMGQVLAGEPKRGFTMQMFMISLAFITWHLTTPAQSLVGRLAGGIFIYAMSIPDAYRLAKIRAMQRDHCRFDHQTHHLAHCPGETHRGHDEKLRIAASSDR